MSRDDFCNSTFGEFESICKAWREMTEGRNRDEWERARTVAAIVIQPHLRKGHRISPRQILPLPWDKQQDPAARHQESSQLSRDERLKRFEELSQRLEG